MVLTTVCSILAIAQAGAISPPPSVPSPAVNAKPAAGAESPPPSASNPSPPGNAPTELSSPPGEPAKPGTYRDPAEKIRLQMEEGLQKQRHSVRKQWEGLHGKPAEPPTFFTNPWPEWPSPWKADENKSFVWVFPGGLTPGAGISLASAQPFLPLPFPCDPLEHSLLDPIIESAAARHGLPSRLIQSVIGQESARYPCAVSRAGAIGLMQLMPGTAESLGVRNPFDPEQNVDGGARFLKTLIERFGDLGLALGAYNAGPGAVEEHGGIPPFRETRHYVTEVLRRFLGQPPETIPPVP